MNSEKQLQYITNPDQSILKSTPTEFLESIGGPVVIDISGHDSSRTRLFSTLIHGNEPSGFIAFHQWLQQLAVSKQIPTTNIRIIIPSVAAALNPPLFTCRYLSGCKDLNRCFGSNRQQGEQYLLANEIETAIRAVNPEAIIDLHNTSGSSPAFSVAIASADAEKNLAAFFCNQLIHTEIRLGALMELDFGCPIVTIECGGADDLVSVKRAYHGIKQITELNDLKIELENETVDVFKQPIRVQINSSKNLAYADHKIKDVSLVLVSDNERRNFGVTHSGTFLGWLEGSCNEVIIAKNQAGENVSNQLFEVKNGKLYTAKNLNFFMATDRADIAKGDCLFYITEVAV